MSSHISDTLVAISKYIALIYGFIFIYSFITYPFDPFLQNSLFLQIIFILAFLKLIRETYKTYLRIIFLFLMVISLISVFYISLNYIEVAYKAGIPNQVEFIFGLIAISSIIALTWVFVGRVLALTTLLFIAYAYLGKYMPGFWGHGGYPLDMLIGYFYMTREGLWSLPLNIASTYVIAFMMLGSLLTKIKAVELIIGITSPLTKIKGGPGIAAVQSNLLLGMVSGSAPENVALTGTAFKSALKEYGFSPEKSAAIIASAASKALIMPPVMGAAAFLMADLLGIPYRDIAIAAFLPGLLSFIYLMIYVYLDSSKDIAKGLIRRYQSAIVNRSSIVRDYVHTIIPLFVVTYYILSGYSPFRAAVYGIIASIMVSLIRKSTRIGLKDMIDAIYIAMNSVISLGIAIASASLVYSAIMMTGLGVKISLSVISAGNLVLALILVMLSCIILGMGLPATVAYLIVAITMAPAIINMGIHPLAAHMFIFYFSSFSTITPPVALAIYVACAIFNADPIKSGIIAIRMALPAFIMPYIFIFRPSLLLLGGNAYEVAVEAFLTLLALFSAVVSLNGYLIKPLQHYMRVLYGLSALLLIIPDYFVNMIGIVILVITSVIILAKNKLILLQKNLLGRRAT
jgi:TRAP transporter 4TM/12TM fusion protein